ncbi:hypothetical protein HMPREF0495_02229 [Levilactobacillus brevis ATCC 14869 = DSM 20054]|uniref:Uncharacterized protein n=1 Tax=Levilactobacillus brevis ATCC 14869 = DSM 20054 TaxID=649758 RepID=U2NTT4_LEVBR|nr:hypothetical protein HMPREF0495_02229 [Levilactobacillus brevis ATCC 14869 = DSM 20054]
MIPRLLVYRIWLLSAKSRGHQVIQAEVISSHAPFTTTSSPSIRI